MCGVRRFARWRWSSVARPGVCWHVAPRLVQWAVSDDMRLESAPYLVLPPLRFAGLIVLAQWMRRLGDATAALRYAAGGGGGGGGGSLSRESLLLGDDAATTATDGGASACGGEEGAAVPRLAHVASFASDGSGERKRDKLDRVKALVVMRARAAELARANASVFTRSLNPVYATEVRACRRCRRRPPHCQPKQFEAAPLACESICFVSMRQCGLNVRAPSASPYPPTVMHPCRSVACTHSGCPPTTR